MDQSLCLFLFDHYLRRVGISLEALEVFGFAPFATSRFYLFCLLDS